MKAWRDQCRCSRLVHFFHQVYEILIEVSRAIAGVNNSHAIGHAAGGRYPNQYRACMSAHDWKKYQSKVTARLKSDLATPNCLIAPQASEGAVHIASSSRNLPTSLRLSFRPLVLFQLNAEGVMFAMTGVRHSPSQVGEKPTASRLHIVAAGRGCREFRVNAEVSCTISI